MSENMHILRKLRLQLKTGFLRKEPSTYAFLKRYPPLSRDAAKPVRTVEQRNIPYLKLYEKAIAKNPLYADEKVYQAYWAHEPQALTLAKKQYEFMGNGDTETVAYEKAVTYVEQREGEAYDSLKKLMSDLGDSMGGVDVKLPFLATAEKDLNVTLSMFGEMLSNTPYSDLDLADQGEIDYFIQTKVLQWNEVERERRMKDPIFVRQFERLRSSLLPEIGISSDEATERRHAQYKDKLLKFFDINKSRLSAARPFYYEEYQKYFEKLKGSPVLSKWAEAERTEFSHWIIDTLAVREMLDKNTTSTIQLYLDKLRAQFFPMIKYPLKASEYSLPPVEELKQVLYSNDVGYKKNEGQLYIRRYYLLPQLLFPVETIATAITSDKGKMRSLSLASRDAGAATLLEEIRSAGFDEASVPQLERQLQEYISGSIGSIGGGRDHTGGENSGGSDGVVDRGGRSGSGDRTGDLRGADMSTLDALLRDDDDLEPKALSSPSPSASTSAATGAAVASGDSSSAASSSSSSSSDSESGPVSAEWGEIIKKYLRQPTTALEEERQELLSSLEFVSPEQLTSEHELSAFKRNRTETELLARARLAVMYERKEAARRSREWQRRGMVLDSLPAPALELDDEVGR